MTSADDHGWLFGSEAQHRDKSEMRRKSGGMGALKNKTRKHSESTCSTSAKAVYCSTFGILLTEPFELNLYLIKIHNLDKWVKATMTWRLFKFWEYDAHV